MYAETIVQDISVATLVGLKCRNVASIFQYMYPIGFFTRRTKFLERRYLFALSLTEISFDLFISHPFALPSVLQIISNRSFTFVAVQQGENCPQFLSLNQRTSVLPTLPGVYFSAKGCPYSSLHSSFLNNINSTLNSLSVHFKYIVISHNNIALHPHFIIISSAWRSTMDSMGNSNNTSLKCWYGREDWKCRSWQQTQVLPVDSVKQLQSKYSATHPLNLYRKQYGNIYEALKSLRCFFTLDSMVIRMKPTVQVRECGLPPHLMEIYETQLQANRIKKIEIMKINHENECATCGKVYNVHVNKPGVCGKGSSHAPLH